MITTYLYSQSGHNFGFENLRREAAIFKKLAHLNPTFATGDYRAVTYAKEELGVKNGVGIDVIENLPNMMLRMDILIFDSKEPTDTMKKYMKDFCSHLYEVGVDIPYDIIDDIYFEKIDSTIEKCFFFADDDYENELIEFCKDSKQYDINLLLGHYFFFPNEAILAKSFKNIIESEDYIDTIRKSKYLLTSSVNACIESLASGNFPVYFQRKVKPFKGELELLEKYNIPTIDAENLDTLIEEFDKVILNYPQTNKIEKVDISHIVTTIEDTVKKYEAVIQ